MGTDEKPKDNFNSFDSKPEVMEIDFSKEGANSSVDFDKMIKSMKMNGEEVIEYLGTSVGSPYEKNGFNKNKKMSKFDLNMKKQIENSLKKNNMNILDKDNNDDNE